MRPSTIPPVRTASPATKSDAHGPMTEAVAVVGAGSWGTALASLLACAHERVTIWSRGPEVADFINQRGENRIYLPGIKLPGNLRATTDLQTALRGVGVVVMVVPSHAMRETAAVASRSRMASSS